MDITTAIAALQQSITEVEHRRAPLHRIRIDAASMPPVAAPEAVMYCESAVTDADALLASCNGVHHDCSDTSLLTSISATPICVFDDPYAAEGTIWRLVEAVVRHETSGFSNGAVAELQGVIVPTYESAEDTAYSVDLFSDYFSHSDDASAAQVSTQKVLLADDAALRDVVSYLHEAWSVFIDDLGSSHLVLYLKCMRPTAAGTNGLGEPLRSRSTCLVWLTEDTVGGNREGIFADSALQLLMEELCFAAAAHPTQEEAANVLKEDGVEAVLNCCRLTHTVKKVINKYYPAVTVAQRPLFHWIIRFPTAAEVLLSAAENGVFQCRYRAGRTALDLVNASREVMYLQGISTIALKLLSSLPPAEGSAGTATLTKRRAARLSRMRATRQRNRQRLPEQPLTPRSGSLLDPDRDKPMAEHLYTNGAGHPGPEAPADGASNSHRGSLNSQAARPPLSASPRPTASVPMSDSLAMSGELSDTHFSRTMRLVRRVRHTPVEMSIV